MLGSLPSGKGYFRAIPVDMAESLGIFSNGDSLDGSPVYKFLSREGVMFTYAQEGDILMPVEKMGIVPCDWRR